MEERKIRRIALTGEVNEFIKGRVSGIITGITRDLTSIGYAICEHGDTTVFTFDATDYEFDIVCDIVITHYGSMEKLSVEIVRF